MWDLHSSSTGSFKEEQESVAPPHAPCGWAGPSSKTPAPRPPPWSGPGLCPSRTRHSGHQAQGSEHAERPQSLHVKAALAPWRPTLLGIDLLQGHGDEPERVGAQSKGEGEGERKRHEDGNWKTCAKSSEPCRLESK